MTAEPAPRFVLRCAFGCDHTAISTDLGVAVEVLAAHYRAAHPGSGPVLHAGP